MMNISERLSFKAHHLEKVFILLFTLIAGILQNALCQSFDIQGHRGARGLYPENTTRGFLETLRLGVYTLEMDVVITKDSQVVLSHEPWVSATICTIDKDDPEKWNIFQMTYDELKKIDCGSKPHPLFRQQVSYKAYKPLLSEVIDSAENLARINNLPMPVYNIEIKSTPDGDNKYHPAPQTFAELVYNVLQEKNLIDRSIIQSFDIRALRAMKEINCYLKQSLLVSNPQSVRKNIKKLGYNPAIYSPNYRLVNRKTVRICHKNSMKIIPWTVNKTYEMKKMKKIGCDGIITDYPDIAVKLFKSF
ncbi:MAG: glycerophosphodiester phosphodiesterase family protein [Chitinophagales bacterium]|nr:glycerophosphodiester phosphodiesterase [Chitinophagales bacterium]MDW8273285.1 glycerophosphodiester phosphodiesterase family protein [Chitinophagales bacterium]